MNIEEFKHALVNEDSRDIFMKYLQGNDIWYFSTFLKKDNYSSFYDEFKKFIAVRLEISFNNICIVGSGKLGFSLAPEKKFREFHAESDIDLVLVSNKYFNNAWSAYLDLHDQKVKFGYRYVSSDIFRRFVSLKDPDPSHAFFKYWISKVEQFNKDYQTIFDIKHRINYRIYNSWEAVERYHIKGLNELKEIIKNEPSN